MGLKIKWSDDRVRATTTALLLITRDRLSRGDTDELLAISLAAYRNDPAAYKEAKAGWAEVREVGGLTKPAQIAYYKNLVAAADKVVARMVEGKRQFNSLVELDNFLVFELSRV
jgi:hypothetical protein